VRISCRRCSCCCNTPQEIQIIRTVTVALAIHRAGAKTQGRIVAATQAFEAACIGAASASGIAWREPALVGPGHPGTNHVVRTGGGYGAVKRGLVRCDGERKLHLLFRVDVFWWLCLAPWIWACGTGVIAILTSVAQSPLFRDVERVTMGRLMMDRCTTRQPKRQGCNDATHRTERGRRGMD
jgi:hypothetical protein